MRRSICGAVLLLAGYALIACGGGGSSRQIIPMPSRTNAGNAPSAPTYVGPTAPTTLSVTIPAPTSGTTSVATAGRANRRAPQYVPVSTRSIAIEVLQVGGVSVTDAAVVTNLSPGSAPCTTVSSGDYTCTVTTQLPVGTDTVDISLYYANNAAGTVLAEQLLAATVLEGHTNVFGTPASPITLDANPGTVSVAGDSSVTGTYPTFVLSGGTATFSVSDVDADGDAFAGQPGVPTIAHAGATGTGAGATVSDGVLTLVPGSGSSNNVIVDADPAGTVDVTTTLTSSPTAGATTFSVASSTGIFAGQNVVLDYETFNGTKWIQEAASVSNVSGTTITVSGGLTNAHVSGANVRHYSDNLAPSVASFTAAQALIVPVAYASTGSKALVYNTSFSLQTGSLTSATAAYGEAFLDSSDRLYVLDFIASTVYRSQYTPGAGFGAVTTYSGIPDVTADCLGGFDVSSNGTVAVTNNAGTPDLLTFAPGTSASPTGFTSQLGDTDWASNGQPAVLTDASGNVFGYAYTETNFTTQVPNEIAVTDGTTGSEQDITSASIVSGNDCFPGFSGYSPTAWDQGRQSLIYANNGKNGSTYPVLEIAHTGATDAPTLSTSPTTIGAVAGLPVGVAVSDDGTYVAVSWNNGVSGYSVSIYHNPGTGWSSATTLSTTFPDHTAMHFLPSGNLMITDSDGSTTVNFYQFTATGTQVGSTYNAESDYGSGYYIEDFAVSP